MNFQEALFDAAAKLQSQASSIQTEEATKNAFIMPFISRVLGYDVFNPLEVVPEFSADHGIKRGEKVDYAIMKDSEVQILIECKRIGDALDIKGASQLFRYFTVTNARIAVLTNGQVYNFYTDLDASNKMDERPFLVLDLLDIDENLLPELEKLTRDAFDLDSVISAAEELKYVGALKRELAEEFKSPSRDFVKLFMSRVTTRRATVDALSQFTELTKKATKQYLKEQVNLRLKSALVASDTPQSSEIPIVGTTTPTAAPLENEVVDNGVETTEEELAGYQIVKAIACSEVKPQRVTSRDSKSYFAILLDDNNRKTIARLHFNGKSRKYIGLFDDAKVETRLPIEDLDDIYSHAEEIRASVRRFTD